MKRIVVLIVGVSASTVLLQGFPQQPVSPAAPSATMTPNMGSVTEVARRVGPAVTLVRSLDSSGRLLSLGSGFISSDGRIVTNAHVVRGASSVEVMDSDGRLLVATQFAEALSVGLDIVVLPRIAVVRPRLELASATPPIGEHLLVFGAPQGLANTVSDGILSAVRQLDGRTVLQLTAPISHGSSGGPVVDLKGQVIGIATAYLEDGQNLNFAVVAEDIRGMLGSPAGKYSFPAADSKNKSRDEPTEIRAERIKGSSLSASISPIPISQAQVNKDNFALLFFGCFGEAEKRAVLCVVDVRPQSKQNRYSNQIAWMASSLVFQNGRTVSATGFWSVFDRLYQLNVRSDGMFPLVPSLPFFTNQTVDSVFRLVTYTPAEWSDGAQVSLNVTFAEVNRSHKTTKIRNAMFPVVRLTEIDGSADELTRFIFGLREPSRP